MTIVSIEIAIAMKCSFVTETDIPKKIWILQCTNVPIHKIELTVCNYSHSIPVPDWCDKDGIVQIRYNNIR